MAKNPLDGDDPLEAGLETVPPEAMDPGDLAEALGSVNRDPRSLRLDFEITRAVYHEDFILGIARGVAFRDLGRQAGGGVERPAPCRPGTRRPRT
jgi:hypothetical protein